MDSRVIEKTEGSGDLNRKNWIFDRISTSSSSELGEQIFERVLDVDVDDRNMIPFPDLFDYGSFYKQIDSLLRNKPDLIVPTLYSAVYPSIIVKQVIREVEREGHSAKPYNPKFALMPDKPYKYFGFSYEKEGESDKISDYFKPILMQMYKEGKNKIMIFEEIVGSTGATIAGVKHKILVALVRLKKEGSIPQDFNLDFSEMKMNAGQAPDYDSHSLYNNYIRTLGTEITSSPEKEIAMPVDAVATMQFFRVLGQSIAKDYLLLKESGHFRE